MTDVTAMEFDRTADPSFVATHGRGLVAGVVLLALLPVPITLLRVLPMYEQHAHFLVFYAPLVCCLTVGYCFYVRDTLARVLFKHLLDPLPQPDPYYRPGLGLLARRLAAKLRITFLTLVPIGLVGGSFYCVTAYISRLQDSVEVAGRVMLGRMPASERRQFLTSSAAPAAPIVPPDSTQSLGAADARKAPPASVPLPTDRGLALGLVDQTALRLYTLRAANIEDIAYFRELTTLYIGVFVCSIGAAMLMILKEHAREVLNLSEEGLLLGGEPELE